MTTLVAKDRVLGHNTVAALQNGAASDDFWEAETGKIRIIKVYLDGTSVRVGFIYFKI